MYNKFFKRFIDITLSLFSLVLLSPLFLVLSIAIKIDSRGPVFFKQKRIGRYRKHFIMLKFRTMRVDTPRDTPTHLFEDPEKYVTCIGRVLRKSSLDEIPQIINILISHMSIIGPRPALWNQYDLLEERDKYGANDIKPGLTGWAQINGRDELPIIVKAAYDGEYVQRISFLFDLECLLRTVLNTIKGKGIVEGTSINKKNADPNVCFIKEEHDEADKES